MVPRSLVVLFVGSVALAACKNGDKDEGSVTIAASGDGGAVTVKAAKGSVTIQGSDNSPAETDDEDDNSKKGENAKNAKNEKNEKNGKGPVIKQDNGGAIRVNGDGTITVQGSKESVRVGNEH